MSRPECMVESPRAAEFESKVLLRRLIATRLYVGSRSGMHLIKDVACFTSSYQRLSKNQANRISRELLQLGITKVGVLGFVITPGVSRDPRVRYSAGRRDCIGRVFRPFSFRKIQVGCVRKIVDFFGLPRTQSFSIVIDVQSVAWCLNLLRKCERMPCKIESLSGEHSRGLMVFVILSNNVVWQESKDDFRARDAHETNHLVQHFAVSPLFQ